METLEPRVMLSADAYSAVGAGAHDLAVKIVDVDDKGQINSTETRGVFYRLNTLKAGDGIFVKRADGTTVEFRVTKVQQYLKDKFPTQDVYGPTPDAELRLITCGGIFDPAIGHYLSNIVVYATQVK